MIAYRFKHVCIESFAVNMPPLEVSSAALEDQLAPLYERLKIPFGTLDKLSGVKTRYFWENTVRPSEVATVAAQRALDKIGFERDQIQALFSCSVTRDYFEPATACIVHGNLGLAESSVAMDISNACIGFSNGILTLGNMIDSGVVKAGVVVSGENIARFIDSSLKYILEKDSIDREELLRLVPTFTLGCGSVAYVLCHESIATKNHRILGAVSRSATQHNDLCEGNGDYFMQQQLGLDPVMYTDSAKIMASAAKLGGRTWPELSELLGWSRDDVDHVFCHQVGKQVNESFYAEVGLDMEKEFTIYKKYGNLVSAALPSCLAIGAEEKGMKEKDKIVLMAYGSGLNALFIGCQW